MFDKNYKKAMENVNVDEQTKEKIFDKIMLKEEVNNHKNPAVKWRVAFACAACIAMVLGVLFVPKNTIKENVESEKSETIVSDGTVAKVLTVSKSYDEIYELIKPNGDFAVYDGTALDDMLVYEDATDMETTPTTPSKPGATTSANMNGSTSDSKSEVDTNNSTGEKDEFSNTTEQVEGVNEADIVKTDGEYIYYINDTTLSIVKADGENSVLLSQTELSHTQSKDLYGEMFLKDDRIVLLKTNYYMNSGEKVVIEIYDITDRTAPKKIAESCQDGYYNSSRMVGNYVYLISNCHINIRNIDKDDPATFVPTTETNGVCEVVPADSIYRYEGENYTNQYTVISAFNYKDGILSDTSSLLGGTDSIYCSQNNILLTDTRYNVRENDENESGTTYTTEKTVVSKLAISNGKIEYKLSGEVDGRLNNQFFIDEHNGYFRFVTTVTKRTEKRYTFDNSEHQVVSYEMENSAALTILDSELKKVGEITDLAKDESVYSVRFMGDYAYFVTFRQVDPLFSADLSDPKNPKILGELKIPGFSEYMYPYGDGLLLGFGMDADETSGRTKDLKLSMFDITDPANVTEQDMTTIDGCQYSPALSSHKAMLVHPGKNLIGFAATDDWRNEKYMIYKYTGDGFEKQAVITVNDQYNYYAMTDIRGLFVGDNFYVVSDAALQVFDIDTFSQILSIKF